MSGTSIIAKFSMSLKKLYQCKVGEYRQDLSNFSCTHLYRGSFMSAHVLLNLFKKLRKSDKMRGLPRILSLFCNEFNKFNNTGA